jgi:hypothetical protein
MGVRHDCGPDWIEVDASDTGPGEFRACDIATAAYPGLATDLQPPTSVLLTQVFVLGSVAFFMNGEDQTLHRSLELLARMAGLHPHLPVTP